jgi:hypothetical protein
MIDKNVQLDGALYAMFGDVDVSPEFDTRVMTRLQGLQLDSAEQANRARRIEQERYRTALLEARKIGRAKLWLLTIDGFGIACLLVVITVTALRNVVAVEVIINYYPYVAVLLGILVAAAPVVGMVVERDHIRLT